MSLSLSVPTGEWPPHHHSNHSCPAHWDNPSFYLSFFQALQVSSVPFWSRNCTQSLDGTARSKTHKHTPYISLARCDTSTTRLWCATKHLRGLGATRTYRASRGGGAGKRNETTEVKDKNSEKTNRVVRDRGMIGKETGKWVNGLMGGKRPVWNRERKRGGGKILY